MNNDQDIELIDRFLHDELSPDELEEFNNRLIHDSEFKELFQFINEVKVVAKMEGRDRIRESVHELFDKETIVSVDKKTPSFPYLTYFRSHPIYAIAATFIVLVASAIILVLTMRSPQEADQALLTDQKPDSSAMAASQVDSLIQKTRFLASYSFNTITLTDAEFGFVSKNQLKAVSLILKVVFTNKYSRSYILTADTLIFLGNFDVKQVQNIYSMPRRYIADYNDTLYRIDKQDRIILPLEREMDSLLVRSILDLK